MKAGREHRVPLTPLLLQLLAEQPRIETVELVFPSRRLSPISDMTMLKVLKENVAPGITVHGWRSTFSDWANSRGFGRDHIEDQLAHVIGSDVERAYRRGDYLEQRRPMMAQWEEYLCR